MIEFCGVGGYGEVGRNMNAVKVNDDVFILDMGFNMQKIVDFEEEGNEKSLASRDELINIGAIPNDNVIKDWANNVKAIVLNHCHLDHIGATPYLANRYDCPVIGTPYTTEVLSRILRDDSLRLKNELKAINPNSSTNINNTEIELIHMTHSTLQTAIVALHTKQGVILYANDFKFDNHPVVGKGFNKHRLKKIGEGNVKALIVDSLYSNTEGKTPSELVAREMLKDVILGTENENDGIIVTTFASNIARLKSIVDFGKKLNRKIVFLGRSLNRYVSAAEDLKLIKFKDVEIIGYADKIKKKLSKIEKDGKGRYLIVCTGNQGEPKSVLTKITNNIFPYNFEKDDHIIFSCKTIPVEPNIINRKKLEEKLKQKKVRIFTDVHSSGHAYREDLRDLIEMTNPENVIPAHGDISKRSGLIELAEEIGYRKNKSVFSLSDGQRIKI